MAILYSFKRYKDTYTLSNQGIVSLSYSQAHNFCGEDTVQVTGTLNPGNSIDFNFTKDGRYSVTVTDGSETIVATIMWYNNLLLSLIGSVQKTLCECKCKGCDECNECTDSMFTLNKILGYFFLTKPQYNPFVDAVAAYMNCQLDDTILCVLTREQLLGLKEVESLTEKLVALYYLAFYFSDLGSAYDEEEIAFIKAKYQSTEILGCIRKQGINITDLEDILENMAVFTVNAGMYINQPPSAVGDNEIDVLNRVTTVLTLAMFTTDTTPVYSDPEGNPVLNLRINSIAGTNEGQFMYNDVPVTPGTVIPATDIISGEFVHVGPNQDAAATDSFTFSLSDTGSTIYTPL